MAIIYVRKSGSDANSGLTIPLAKLTIAGANAIALSGDTADIGVGVFTETDQLCAVSNVLYRGAGMAQTIVSGNIKYITGAHIALINDLKVAVTTMAGWNTLGLFDGANSYATFNRVWIDWGAIVAPSGANGFALTSGTTSKYSNCIFSNYSGLGNRLFVTGSAAIVNTTLKLYNCVFFNNGNGITPNAVPTLYHNSGATNSSVSLKNCILHTMAPNFTLASTIYDNTNPLSVHTNNCHYNTTFLESPVPNFTASEFVGNPLFIDPVGGDFRLQSTSPCINAGTGALP